MPLWLSFVAAPVLRGGEGMCRACGVVAGAETTGFVRVCLRWAREDGNAASARVQWRLQRHPSYYSILLLPQSCLWGVQDPPWRRVAAGGRGRARVHARLAHGRVAAGGRGRARVHTRLVHFVGTHWHRIISSAGCCVPVGLSRGPRLLPSSSCLYSTVPTPLSSVHVTLHNT